MSNEAFILKLVYFLTWALILLFLFSSRIHNLSSINQQVSLPLYNWLPAAAASSRPTPGDKGTASLRLGLKRKRERVEDAFCGIKGRLHLRFECAASMCSKPSAAMSCVFYVHKMHCMHQTVRFGCSVLMRFKIDHWKRSLKTHAALHVYITEHIYQIYFDAPSKRIPLQQTFWFTYKLHIKNASVIEPLLSFGPALWACVLVSGRRTGGRG
jgi:hypothetical protein